MVDNLAVRDIFFGLLAVFVVEGVFLYIAYRKNKALEIQRINEEAIEKVDSLSDAKLKSDLNSELGPK